MEENFYNLEDEDLIQDDGSVYPTPGSGEYSLAYNGEDEEEEMWRGESPESSSVKAHPLILLVKCMTGPVEAYKNLKRAKMPGERFASGCFYPLIALAAVSNFMQLIYNSSDATAVSCMIEGIITFITFFFGYFTTLLGCKALLSKRIASAMDSSYGKNFLMSGFCTLTLFYILFQCVPLLAPVWGLLPIWTIYILTKGAKFLSGKGEIEMRTIIVICSLTILSPLVWNWLAEELLPNI